MVGGVIFNVPMAGGVIGRCFAYILEGMCPKIENFEFA